MCGPTNPPIGKLPVTPSFCQSGHRQWIFAFFFVCRIIEDLKKKVARHIQDQDEKEANGRYTDGARERQDERAHEPL